MAYFLVSPRNTIDTPLAAELSLNLALLGSELLEISVIDVVSLTRDFQIKDIIETHTKMLLKIIKFFENNKESRRRLDLEYLETDTTEIIPHSTLIQNLPMWTGILF